MRLSKFERLLLNAAIFFGWTFFSSLTAGMMLYGIVNLPGSIVAALIAAGLAFFTMLRRSDFGGGNGGAAVRGNPGSHDGGEEIDERPVRLGMVV